ncbi:MAG: lysophospholipid acyltransferase family protein [Bacteroidia bacterium]|nr:lysophospholipid acyltransferase family protein [Bacteroidia bacterium]
MKKFLYHIYSIPLYLLALLPFPLLYLLSDGLCFLAFNLIGYRKKVVYENLRNSFPNYSEKEINAIAKKFYSHLFDTILETFKLLTISKNELKKHGLYTNLEVMDEIINQNKSFVILTGHMGNWEWLPTIWHLEGKANIVGIYHKLSSPFFEWFTKNMRERFGIQMITMENTLRGMIANKNKLTGTGFISDQTPSRENAHWITFLNQDTPVFMGAEKIAKKFNYPVIYCHIIKPKRGYYEIKIDVITMEPQTTPDFYITETFNKLLEADIINQPEIWLWSHRRWKHKRV